MWAIRGVVAAAEEDVLAAFKWLGRFLVEEEVEEEEAEVVEVEVVVDKEEVEEEVATRVAGKVERSKSRRSGSTSHELMIRRGYRKAKSWKHMYVVRVQIKY